MSKVLVTETYLEDIADAIRAKNGLSDTYMPSEMATAISNISSGGTARTSADLTVSGATVTAPAGTYASAASKSVASGSASTPATTITANPSISVSSSGLITATASATQSVTPSVSAGYVSSGTAGTITVSGSNTEQLSTQAAQTIYPSSTDQTIATGKYLTGTQTIKAVTTTNLTAANIKKDVVVQVGDSSDSDRVVSVTGTYEASGGATNYVTGTFTTGSSTGTTETVTIPYTGSGYPIACMVFIEGGAYNSAVSGWYSSMQRYAVGQWTMHKAVQTSTPTYGTSGSANYGVTTAIYKNSTSSSTSYTRTSGMNTNAFSSSDASNAALTCVRFKSSTSLSIYVASTSYGLLAGTTYRYHIIYSS